MKHFAIVSVGLFLLVGCVSARTERMVPFSGSRTEFRTSLLFMEKDAPERVKQEISILRTSKDPIQRGYAAHYLGNMGEQAGGAILALLETLLNDHAPLQWTSGWPKFSSSSTSPSDEAAVALGKIGERTVEPLIELQRDKRESVHEAASKALGKLRSDKGNQLLCAALQKESSPEIRRAIASALGKIADRRTVPSLIDALGREPSPDVRYEIVNALGSIKDPRAGPSLAGELAKDSKSFVRAAAARAMGDINDRNGLPHLLEALGNDNAASVRGNAAEALGKIKDPQAVPSLVRALGNDREATVRGKAAEALGNFDDPEIVSPLVDALGRKENQDYSVYTKLVPSLLKRKDPRVAMAFIEALKIGGPGVREEAAKALRAIKEPRAVVPLVDALMKDPVPSVRRNAADALSGYGDRQAVRPLMEALKTDRDETVRSMAAFALGRLNDTGSVPALIEALKDKNHDVGRCAEGALKTITGKDFGRDYRKWKEWREGPQPK